MMKQFTKQLRWLLASLMLVAGVGSAWAADETITFSSLYSSNTVLDETAINGTNFSITFQKRSGGTATQYYTNGSAVRWYGGGTLTIASSTKTIEKIEITFTQTANTITTNVGTYESGTWTGSASSVVFTQSGTKGHCRISAIAVTYKSGGTSDPSFTVDDVDIAYNATSGSIAYTLNNEVTGGSVSAEVTAGDWLTLGSGTASPISFTCSANTAAAERTATVKLTYTYNSTETVTKNVTVTQAGNPDVVNNISDITAADTYTVRGTIVAKSNRGFIVGDGTGYVYYYNQDYDQSTYNIGDKVKLSGSVVTYGGVFEFNNSTTVTTATESNYVEENPTVLSGADMDSRVASATPTQLSSFVQYEGKLSISGTHYNITDIAGATTAQGSISYPLTTDFTSLDGQTVKVTGYFVGVSSSTYYNTLIGSIEAVAGFVAAPEFSVAEGEYNAAQEVTITCATTGASIYYTLDGTDPTTSSTLYDGTALTISTTTTLKAIASDGTNLSEITSATYTIDARTETRIVLKNGTDYESGHTFTITVGDDFTSPEAWVTFPSGVYLNRANSHLTCTGDNDDLATVNSSTGAVTLVSGATGTINVTIEYPGSENYKPCTGSYTVVVNPAVTPVTGDYVKVTATSDLTDGEYLIVYENESLAFNGSLETLDASGNTIDVTIDNGTIASTTTVDAATFTIDVTAGTIQSASGFYIGQTSDANGMKTSDADAYTNTISIDDDGNAVILASGGAYLRYNATSGQDRFRYFKSATYTGQKTIALYKKNTAPDTRLATTVTLNPATTSYDVTLGDDFTAPTAALDPAAAGSLIYESSNETVATVAANGTVTILAAGTTTITAKFAGNDEYKPSQASYTITVTDPNAKGTETNPYTVAEAIAYIETLGTSTSPNDVYVSGIISQVDSYNSTYKSITYWISDDGTTATQMEVYSGKGLNGADFDAEEDLQVGDEVTVCGKVKMYNSTPEFDKDNYLVAFNRPAAAVEAPVFSVEGGTYTEDKTVTITCATDGAAIYYTLDGTDPTTASTLYTDPVAITTTTTLKAIASDGTNTSTITEAKYTINKPTPTTTEAFVLVEDGTITEGDYLIVYDGGAMNTTVESNRLQFAEVSPDYNNIISTNNASIIWHIAKSGSYYTIYNAAANAYAAGTEAKNNAQMLADGTSNKALWTVEATAGETTFDFTNKANEAKGVNATLRRNGTFGFACYSTITGDPLSLYKKVSTVSIDLIAAQDNYKTMVAPYDMVVPNISDGIEAYIVTLNSEQTEADLKPIVNIPAGTPIILHANSEGSYELEKAGTDFTADDVSENVLLVSNGEIEGDGTIFVLNNVSGIGFYPLNEGKTLACGKCYLTIKKSSGVKFIGFNVDDVATGIETVESTMDKVQGTIYDLQGRRVTTPAHGLYIVNGKKVFIK